MRCSLLRLEKVAWLVSMAYTSPLNISVQKPNVTTTDHNCSKQALAVHNALR